MPRPRQRKAKVTTPVPLDLRLMVASVVGQGWPEPVYEHAGIPGRRYRFDCAWPRERVAFERHGLAAGGRMGRHQRIEGWMNDLEKATLSQLNGWLIIQAAPRQIQSGQAAAWVVEALRMRSR